MVTYFSQPNHVVRPALLVGPASVPVILWAGRDAGPTEKPTAALSNTSPYLRKGLLSKRLPPSGIPLPWVSPMATQEDAPFRGKNGGLTSSLDSPKGNTMSSRGCNPRSSATRTRVSRRRSL